MQAIRFFSIKTFLYFEQSEGCILPENFLFFDVLLAFFHNWYSSAWGEILTKADIFEELNSNLIANKDERFLFGSRYIGFSSYETHSDEYSLNSLNEYFFFCVKTKTEKEKKEKEGEKKKKRK